MILADVAYSIGDLTGRVVGIIFIVLVILAIFMRR
jgi:hypothetical protein